MPIVRGINDALSFFLEIGMLAAFAYWGFTTGSTAWLSALLGVAIVVVVVAIWGLLLAPKASRRLADPWHTLLTLILMGLAALALSVSGHVGLALAFGILVVINQLLKHLAPH